MDDTTQPKSPIYRSWIMAPRERDCYNMFVVRYVNVDADLWTSEYGVLSHDGILWTEYLPYAQIEPFASVDGWKFSQLHDAGNEDVHALIEAIRRVRDIEIV